MVTFTVAHAQIIDIGVDSRYDEVLDTYIGDYPGLGYDVYLQSGLFISGGPVQPNRIRWSIASLGYFNIPSNLPETFSSNGVNWEKVYYFYDESDGESSEVWYVNSTIVPVDYEGTFNFQSQTVRETPGNGIQLDSWYTFAQAINGATDNLPGNDYFRVAIRVGNTPLPVKLTTFKASEQEGQAYTSWSTTEEVGFDRFEVQRSLDGKSGSFMTVGKVSAKGVNGKGSSYGFTDRDAPKGQLLYYRLKMVDLDGTSELSHIESLALSGASASVYPNPAKNFVTVSAAEPIRSLELINMAGHGLNKTRYAGDRKVETLELRNAPAGIYQVKIEGVSGNAVFRKIVVGE